MSKMTRLQKLIDKDQEVKERFGRLHPKIIEMLNYVLLQLDDGKFKIYVSLIHVEYIFNFIYQNNYSDEIRSISLYTDYETNNSAIIEIYAGTSNTRIYLPTLNSGNFLEDNIIAMRLFLFYADHIESESINRQRTWTYNCTDDRIRQAILNMFAEDVANGVTKYLREYIIFNKDYIGDIIQKCSESKFHEMTMEILRICQEENLHNNTEIRL